MRIFAHRRVVCHVDNSPLVYNIWTHLTTCEQTAFFNCKKVGWRGKIGGNFSNIRVLPPFVGWPSQKKFFLSTTLVSVMQALPPKTCSTLQFYWASCNGLRNAGTEKDSNIFLSTANGCESRGGGDDSDVNERNVLNSDARSVQI